MLSDTLKKQELNHTAHSRPCYLAGEYANAYYLHYKYSKGHHYQTFNWVLVLFKKKCILLGLLQHIIQPVVVGLFLILVGIISLYVILQIHSLLLLYLVVELLQKNRSYYLLLSNILIIISQGLI